MVGSCWAGLKNRSGELKVVKGGQEATEGSDLYETIVRMYFEGSD